jgi:hypothetical protein
MVVHFFTQISIVAYMIVASTIDGNGWIPIHRYSAIVFLVSMLINVILNSISLTLIKVRGSTKVVMWSYGIKLFICL